MPPSEGDGEVAGVSYRVRGSGPPLLLLPIERVSSQWEPLLPVLAQHYSTTSLGGAWLGFVATMEARAKGGYLETVGRMVDETRLQPGERVLDVGCGPGTLDCWLAHRTGGANPIVGVDISPYLTREAAALARGERLDGVIEFREGSAEALPFPENSFDVSLSFTLIQLVDANQMLAEMVRVTKPGGRVGVVGRGDDRPNIINLPVRAELKAKAEAQRDQEAHNPQGCDDASLYRRFHQAGLIELKMLPQLAVYTDRTRLQFMQQNQILPVLTPEEREEWIAAAAEVEAEGTFFIAELFNCAVGNKPG